MIRGRSRLRDAAETEHDPKVANPDPTATVRFGEQAWDEMMIGYYEWSRDTGEGSPSE